MSSPRAAVAAAIGLIGLALAGCATAATGDGESPTSAACEEFADAVRALYDDIGTYVKDEREASGEKLQDFLDGLDAIALSADDDAQDRMFTIIENFPIAGAIMRGYGMDFERFVEQYNAVARACDAAGAPIGDYPAEFQH